MLVEVPDLLSPDQVAALRTIIDRGEWADGNATSGAQAARAKRNAQLAEGTPAARQGQEIVLDALERSALFVSAALPLKVYPPLFNRYAGGQRFGNHVDNAIRPVRGTNQRVRTDLSATLFLEDPDAYDGGELIVEDTYGTHTVKLPAGHMILYPSTSVHRVSPVTRGARVAAFFWIQSMIRSDADRTTLFELDKAIQALQRTGADDAAVVTLTGLYHNLIRRWAEV